MSDEPSNNRVGEDRDLVLSRANDRDIGALDELLDRAESGDRDSLTRLVQLGLEKKLPEALERLMTFARRHLVQAARSRRHCLSDDPESMAQDGSLELLRKPPVLQDYTAAVFVGYLNTMARNWACDQERRRRLRRQTTLGGETDGHRKPPIEGADPMPATVAREKWEVLLSRCPDEQDRFVIRKRFEDGLAYERIGRLVEPVRSADAVRMQIVRILMYLGDDPLILREAE